MVDFAEVPDPRWSTGRKVYIDDRTRGHESLRPGTLVDGPWPEQGVAFRVRRGLFRVSKAVHANEVLWSQELGRRLPPADMGKLVLTVMPEGDEVVVRWRVIRVVAA